MKGIQQSLRLKEENGVRVCYAVLKFLCTIHLAERFIAISLCLNNLQSW